MIRQDESVVVESIGDDCHSISELLHCLPSFERGPRKRFEDQSFDADFTVLLDNCLVLRFESFECGVRTRGVDVVRLEMIPYHRRIAISNPSN